MRRLLLTELSGISKRHTNVGQNMPSQLYCIVAVGKIDVVMCNRDDGGRGDESMTLGKANSL